MRYRIGYRLRRETGHGGETAVIGKKLKSKLFGWTSAATSFSGAVFSRFAH